MQLSNLVVSCSVFIALSCPTAEARLIDKAMKLTSDTNDRLTREPSKFNTMKETPKVDPLQPETCTREMEVTSLRVVENVRRTAITLLQTWSMLDGNKGGQDSQSS